MASAEHRVLALTALSEAHWKRHLRLAQTQVEHLHAGLARHYLAAADKLADEWLPASVPSEGEQP